MTTRTHWLARLFGTRPRVTVTTIAVDTPTALSVNRVGEALSRRNYRFRIDEEGDITGTWDGHLFWFMLRGANKEILRIRGRWSSLVHTSSRLAVLQVVNDWNREHVLPKAFVREEQGGLALYTEVAVDFEPGATDAQLSQVVTSGLATSVRLFAAIGPQLRLAAGD